MSVLNQYKVKFMVRNLFNTNVKSILTISDMLSAYITDLNTANKVNQLLNDITEVLNHIHPLGGGQTQSTYLAHITATETKIYQDMEEWEENNNIQPDFTLPTSDFKVIVEAWRDYLQQ